MPSLSTAAADYVSRSLRDVADQDYIAARLLYRAVLPQQFLWAALQALEKYLKGIHLFNGRSVRDYGHDLLLPFDHLGAITDIPFEFPQDLRRYLAYIEYHGPNRYFEKPYFLAGNELLDLDKAVWHLRRYCQDMPRGVHTFANGATLDLFAAELSYIRSFTPRRAHAFRISGGFLERVLSERSSSLRAGLVWKNFYYGSYTKRSIRFRRHMSSANPTSFLMPAAFAELKPLLRFSTQVHEYFRSRRPR